jgi:hypothetical protein
MDTKYQYETGIRCKGFTVAAASGTTQTTLDLSGFAKQFVGIALVDALATSDIQLVINNDVVIENTNAQFFNTDDSNPRAFTEFNRPLTGQDTITLKTQATAANTYRVVVYYRNAYIG